MPAQVHAQLMQRRYVAPWISLACLLNTLIVIGAFILPIYIAWASNSFWIKQHLQWEQPTLTYQNQFIVTLEGLKGIMGAQQPFRLQWSTSPNANDMYGGIVRSPVLKSSTRDFNLDGKPDQLRLTLSMPLLADEVITSVSAVAFVDVALQTVTRLSMDGLLAVQYASATPGASFVADGDLTIVQRDSIPFATGGVYTPYLWTPLTALDAATSITQTDPRSLLAAYRERNITTQLEVPYPLWTTDTAYTPVTPNSASDMSQSQLIPRVFTLEVTARVPPAAVLVRPGVSEELKHGWIQYVSFLSVTLVVAWLFRHLLFAYGVVETTLYVDAPRGKAHVD